MADHPLDRPAWNALNSLQGHHAVGSGAALRFHPEIGPISAASSYDPAGLAALAALVPDEGILATIEARPHALPPGTIAEKNADLVQLFNTGTIEPYDDPALIPLGPADAPEMLALATLTEPGPFASRTHELGTFWGIRIDGRLAAMAGERMRMPGYGEVSAVCVHPDFQGQGLGAIVCRKAMATVAGAGLTPFLHAYADNHAALALYRKLGFTVRHIMTVMMFRKAP